MATTRKRVVKKPRSEASGRPTKESRLKQSQAMEVLRRERDEALEQLAAASDILRLIARSPTQLQPVLDAVAETAARVCGANDAIIRRVDGSLLTLMAHYGPIPGLGAGDPIPLSRGSVHGRAVIDQQTIHIHDLAAEPEDEFPVGRALAQRFGYRTILVTPLLREGVPIGAILIRRTVVRPFTDSQIKLLETFADQAVIAIENVRLFQELQARNRDLTEALEQQTVTSEILRVIASSPTDIQSVLDVVAESAARLCEAVDAKIRLVEGEGTRLVASFGSLPGPEFNPTSPRNVSGRAILTRETLHIHDLQEAVKTEFPESVGVGIGVRTFLSVPMLREGNPIGLINIRRTEVRPFSDRQIALLKTFADQAVIAIENVRLFKELQDRNRDLTEALEQQTTTSEILRVISSSPTDLQPVMDAIAENAARLCEANDALIHRIDGDSLKSVANYGPLPRSPGGDLLSIDRGLYIPGRAVIDRQTIHIHDLAAEPEDDLRARFARSLGVRTVLATPLLREGVPIGTIMIRRMEVRPFTEKQIKLLETFADQAVIAIENVRLFQELTEALEQQTATSEILGVIASSPTDIQPVLNAVAESAARLCEADDALITRIDGDSLKRVANYGSLPGSLGGGPISIDRGSIAGRAIIDRQTIHIRDFAAEPEGEFPNASLAKTLGLRTVLATPLLRESVPIGTIMIRRIEVRPFSEKQIKLLETFADQAVIAIENVRLFKELQERNAELREALEHQTATAEVLGIISRSTFDLEPVLQTLVENAARLCRANAGTIWRFDGELLRLAGAYNVPPDYKDFLEQNPIRPGRGTTSGRVALERRVVHTPDVLADPEYEFAEAARRAGAVRTHLGVPMLREGTLLGVIIIRRTEVQPFTDKQIELVTTFADQAVIAIENVRLFQELQARNRDLTEALEQQTATGEVLRVIASSPTELQPVLDTLLANAVKLSGATKGHVRQVEGEFYPVVAHYGESPERIRFLRANPLPASPKTPIGRALVEHRPVHVLDVQLEPEPVASLARQTGARTLLAAPLLREGTPIGGITIWRETVEPFTERQIEVIKTFADQAVIAIENVRLFTELEDRNRRLSEALEQQTATSEILRVIASSPTDIQPVLNTVAANAARLCEATDVAIRLVEGDGL
jgi:GAF domain-containing protein